MPNVENGYKLSVANRKNKMGGGIALTCRSEVKMRKLKSGTTNSFEFGIWQLMFKNITMHAIGIYRPQWMSTCAQFLTGFFQFMEDTMPELSNIIIMGDFNLHVNENNATTTDFKDSLFAMGLEQHVTFSTHVAGNSLDLVITEVVNGVEVLYCESGAYVSDHCAVKVKTNVQTENIISKSVTFRN